MPPDPSESLLDIGSGTLVYKTKHPTNPNFYAAKKIFIEKDTLAKCSHEYEMHNKVSYIPGIPDIYAKTNNSITYQLLGHSLKSFLDSQEHSFSLKNILFIGISIIKILKQLHTETNIIHRDIKPSNILYSRDMKTIFLIDFGISCVQSSQNPTKEPFKGTIRYASLNAHSELPQLYKDDLESLGYVLLDLYYKKLPWDFQTSSSEIHQTKISFFKKKYHKKYFKNKEKIFQKYFEIQRNPKTKKNIYNELIFLLEKKWKS